MSGDAGTAPGGWQRQAACRAADPELFFPVPGRGSAEQVVQAKALCGGCRVRRQCLQYAISAGEAYGVWGGLTEDERGRFGRLGRGRHVSGGYRNAGGLAAKRPGEDPQAGIRIASSAIYTGSRE